MPFGYVSSSGYGDGGYETKYCEDEHGEIFAIRIIFIGEEEEVDEKLPIVVQHQ